MIVTGAWRTDPATQALCTALVAGGYRALFVGGCVRNSLLGMPVGDVDLSTDALPEIVSIIAKNAGFKPIPTGIEHGTVTVVAGGVPHEVTTFRKDIETDGRRAVVAFSTHIEDDAARRDFTMNALYAEPDGKVIDPLGGLPDLLARRVRFVGDAEQRIAEDYLRVLRFFRFFAWYGDRDAGIDADGLAACAAALDGLESLSRERVGAEMRKLLAAPDPASAVASMAQAGILNAILPGADSRALAPLIHLEGMITPRWQRRLAVLGGEDVADRLRLSSAQSRDLGKIRDEIGTGSTPAALGWMLGPDLATDVILCRAALLESPLPPMWQDEVARGAVAEFPVKAADLMPALQGAALGVALRAMEQRWLAADLRPGKADLLA
jgi:poly(A) polymerase